MRPALLISAGVALGVMAWLTGGWEDWTHGSFFRGQKQDYYNLLVDGFQDGHLYLKAAVDPGRLSPDIQVRLRSPYLMDASEYHGRYYLYFGVVPAVLVLWPYAAITGHDLQQNVAVWLAVAAGFLICLRLYAAARTRYFPTASAWTDVGATLLLAFATGSPALLVASGMYEIAIAYGYAFTAAFLASVYGALHSDRPARWLAAASLCFGLSVGCRPTFILLAPVLLAAGLLRWRRDERPRRAVWQYAAAVLGPAAAVGLGLMAYNYERFGSMLEFGIRYQVNALQGTGKPLASLAFIPLNLGWYYFSLPDLTAFFPYVFPLDTSNAPSNYFGWEPVHGQWLALVLVVGTVIVAASWWRKPGFRPAILLQFLGLVLASFVVMALVTASFGIRSDRYMVDFQSSLILLAVILGGCTLQLRTDQRWIRWWQTAWAILAGAVVFQNLGMALQLLDTFKNRRGETYGELAYLGNRPASWLARLGWHRYGPLRFKVEFRRPNGNAYEPLVATGTPGATDVIYAAQYPNGYVEFVATHEGHGGARTGLIPVEYGRAYTFELDMGSLYPPVACDYFPGWKTQPREILRSYCRIVFDGTPVLLTRQEFYESSPGTLQFGSAAGRPEHHFSGRIFDIERRPLPAAAELEGKADRGVVLVKLGLPPADNLNGQPVLSSGVRGHGNLLFLRNLPDGTFQFGLDFWGLGASYSPPLPRGDQTMHTVELFVAPQVARRGARELPELDFPALSRMPAELRVWLDGRLVWNAKLTAHADTYEFTGLGTNTQGFTTAGALYQGPFQAQPLNRAEERTFIEKNLAAVPP